MSAEQYAIHIATHPPFTLILSTAGMDQALQLRGADDDTRWQVGDLSLREIEKRVAKVVIVDGLEHVITKDEVRRAIGDLAGMESSTVRAREETAEYWSRVDRVMFADLTYSYFRAAMYAENHEAARAHLAEALRSADDYGGYIMPVRVLRAKVKMQRRGDSASSSIEPPDLAETLRTIDAAIADAQALPDAVAVQYELEDARDRLHEALAQLGDRVTA